MKTIYSVYGGSRAYGLNGPSSDTDIRQVYLPEPNEILMGQEPKVTHTINAIEDFAQYPIFHFFSQLRKGNISALELLMVNDEDVIVTTPYIELIKENFHIFLSKRYTHSISGHIKQANGIIFSKDMNITDKRKYKMAAEAFRILSEGIDLFTNGYFRTKLSPENQSDLYKIKYNTSSFDYLFYGATYERLLEEYDEAYKNTRLPDEPDNEAIDKMLSAIVYSYINETYKGGTFNDYTKRTFIY